MRAMTVQGGSCINPENEPAKRADLNLLEREMELNKPDILANIHPVITESINLLYHGKTRQRQLSWAI